MKSIRSGPKTSLIFSAGPLTGANVPTSGRYAVVAKSPLTGIWGEADSGGRFGIALKAAGFDAIAISGQAPLALCTHGSLMARFRWCQQTPCGERTRSRRSTF